MKTQGKENEQLDMLINLFKIAIVLLIFAYLIS